MATFQHPVIVIPGIMGTTLHDEYPLQTVDLWTMILNRDFHRISLHPDDLRFEAVEPARLYAGRLFGIYSDLIEALRYDLSERADEPTPVFAFPYDWRRDVRETAKELREFVEEVVARTRLLRHYAGYEEVDKVDLVGHSMGGLLICEYLHQFGKEKRVGKVATLGTPFLGSMEAVVKLTTGLGNLSGARPSERERETARSTPAVYQLLPSYDGAVVTADGIEASLFEVTNWQQTVLESLAEYVRMHAVRPARSKAGRLERAVEILTSLLQDASDHRDHVKSLRLSAAGLKEDDWLAVIGVGEDTRQAVTIQGTGKNIRFGLDELSTTETEEDTGDGTVPLRGAMPPFLKAGKPVAVTAKDFGRFEVGDRVLLLKAGLHALLPNMNLVQRLVIAHLRPKFRGKIWGRPVPVIEEENWEPPLDKLR